MKRFFRMFRPIERTAFFLYIAIPTVTYFPTNPVLSRTIRAFLYLSVATLLIGHSLLRTEFVKTIRAFRKDVKLAVLILCAFFCLSVLRAFVSGAPGEDVIFGAPPEYLGAVMWFVFILLGIGLRQGFKRYIASPFTLVMVQVGLIASLLWQYYYLLHGMRLDGLMYQATTMSFYACLGLVLALNAIRPFGKVGPSNPNRGRIVGLLNIAAVAISSLAIITTQSRVGYMIMICTFGYWAWRVAKPKRVYAAVAVVAIVALAILPRAYPDYFSRLQGSTVSKGVAYRNDIYKTTARDTLKPDRLIGKGPSALPDAINNKNAVPEEIAKSLNEDFIFSSTHDLYLDFVYMFGVLSALVLLYLTIRSLLDGLHEDRLYLLLFAVILANALLNVPSLELTSLFFVGLFALLASRSTKEVTADAR